MHAYNALILEDIVELRERAVAMRTYGDEWSWEEDAKELRADVAKTLDKWRYVERRYRRNAERFNCAMYERLANGRVDDINELAALRDELTEGIRAFQQYVRHRDRENKRILDEWREDRVRRLMADDGLTREEAEAEHERFVRNAGGR